MGPARQLEAQQHAALPDDDMTEVCTPELWFWSRLRQLLEAGRADSVGAGRTAGGGGPLALSCPCVRGARYLTLEPSWCDSAAWWQQPCQPSQARLTRGQCWRRVLGSGRCMAAALRLLGPRQQAHCLHGPGLGTPAEA